MDRLISCEFNMDTACVELKFADGSMIGLTLSLWRTSYAGENGNYPSIPGYG